MFTVVWLTSKTFYIRDKKFFIRVKLREKTKWLFVCKFGQSS